MRKKTKYLALGLSVLLLVGVGASVEQLRKVWAAIDTTMLPTILRSHTPAADVDGSVLQNDAEKANVLFLLDVGSPMLFTSKGQLPIWNTILAESGNSAATARSRVNAMLAESTYGSGGRDKTPSSSYGTARAGRDVDPTNNVVGSADCYYIPSASNNLTYENGVSGKLMANDSRMYKMKLVFWRLLEDQSLFERLRFGMATTYQEENVANTYRADFYKAGKYGVSSSYPYYTNGTGPEWVTGIGGSGGYGESQEIQWGIDQDAYNNASYAYPHNVWYAVNRANLRVPFGDYSADHLRKFRKLINGIENLNSDTSANADFRTIDPELLADGKTPLANSIFPASPAGANIRATFLSNALVYYSNRTAEYKKTQQFGSNTYHWFGKRSGEAVGTVLDFFSPPISGKGTSTSAVNVDAAVRGNFPIRNRCESNWLVVFTAGDDSSTYSSAQAVKDLYDYTDVSVNPANKFVMLSADAPAAPNSDLYNATTDLFPVTLFKPIRTIVVGFADPVAQPALKIKLDAMADFGDDGKANKSATAYLANDVPGLIAAMGQVLRRINAEIQGSSAPMMVNPNVEEDAAAAEAYSPNYKRQGADQWKGFLIRFNVATNASGDMKLTKDWELHAVLSRDAGSALGGRKLVTWDYRSTSSYLGNLAQIALPNLVSTPHALAPLMGLETTRLNNYTASTPHPSNLMLRWMHGADYSYTTKKSTQKPTMLSDMGNSGYVLVGRVLPTSIHDQPGYREWVNSSAIASRSRTLYLHSNDGLLHAVNVTAKSTDQWALERWAFIPPNVLSNQRLAGLKFKLDFSGTTQRAEWMNTEAGSNAAFLTDGTVRTQNLATNSTNWQTYLFGSMGRGGAGLYTMQISNPDAPQFLWAVENNPYSFNTNSSKGSIHFWNSLPNNSYSETPFNNLTGGFSPTTRDYRRLGIASPPPAVASTLVGTTHTNVGVLAGGMQYDLDLTKNGTIGSAIYVFNPLTGDLIQQFNAASTIKWAEAGASTGSGANPQMGMVVTPPTLVTKPTPQRYLEGFFTADNRGNIFEGRFADNTGASFHSSISNWTLARVASLKNVGETAASANFVIPYEMSVARAPDRNLWIFGGTSDVNARNIGEELFADNKVSKPGTIVNQSQWLFGFRNPDRTSGASLLLRSDSTVKSLNAEVSADVIDPKTKNGWTIPLRVATGLDAREYLSAATLLYGDYIIAATFIPLGTATNDCTMDGKSRIYLLDAITGGGMWPTSSKKYLELTGIKISGVTVSFAGKTPRLFLSISILNSTGFDLLTSNSKRLDGDYGKADATLHSEALASLGLPIQDPIGSGGEKLNYWREVFNKR